MDEKGSEKDFPSALSSAARQRLRKYGFCKGGRDGRAYGIGGRQQVTEYRRTI